MSGAGALRRPALAGGGIALLALGAWAGPAGLVLAVLGLGFLGFALQVAASRRPGDPPHPATDPGDDGPDGDGGGE